MVERHRTRMRRHERPDDEDGRQCAPETGLERECCRCGNEGCGACALVHQVDGRSGTGGCGGRGDRAVQEGVQVGSETARTEHWQLWITSDAPGPALGGCLRGRVGAGGRGGRDVGRGGGRSGGRRRGSTHRRGHPEPEQRCQPCLSSERSVESYSRGGGRSLCRSRCDRRSRVGG